MDEDDDRPLPIVELGDSANTRHEFFLSNPWKVSKGKFALRDILLLRTDKALCFIQRIRIRECILSQIDSTSAKSTVVDFGRETKCRPC